MKHHFNSLRMSSLLSDNVGLVLTAVGIMGTLGLLFFVTESGPSGKIPFGPQTHIIITGGSSGIGLATAMKFRQLNCNVTIMARSEAKLEEARVAIEQKSKGRDGALNVVSADVSAKELMHEAVQNACAKFNNRVDVLICSAGVSRPGRLEEVPTESYEQMMRINFLGSLYSAMAVAPLMKRQGGGRILFVSSLAGLAGMIGFSGYSPSKFAVRGLAESLQMELRPFNIFTSLVNPPDVDTPMLQQEAAFKPEECRIISEGGGLFSAEALADDVVGAVASWRFMVNTGLDGYLLGLASAGISCPSHSTLNTFVEVFFAGVLRLVGLMYLRYWNSVCSKHHEKRMREEDAEGDGVQRHVREKDAGDLLASRA